MAITSAIIGGVSAAYSISENEKAKKRANRQAAELIATPLTTPPSLSTTSPVRKRAKGQGRQSTILTGPRGVELPAPTAPHTLLGE